MGSEHGQRVTRGPVIAAVANYHVEWLLTPRLSTVHRTLSRSSDRIQLSLFHSSIRLLDLVLLSLILRISRNRNTYITTKWKKRVRRGKGEYISIYIYIYRWSIVRKRIAPRYTHDIARYTQILGSSEFLKRVTREWVFNQGIPDNRSPRGLPPPS